MVVLKILLWFLLGYYLLKGLAKWLIPKLLAYAAKKVQERFEQPVHKEPAPYETGKTTIVKKPASKAKPSKKVGEYIDFEEIDPDPDKTRS